MVDRKSTWKIGLIAVYLVVVYSLVSAGTVTVSWDANSENDLNGYKIYYGKSSRNYDQVIDVGNVVTSTIGDLEANTTYYFALTAYDFVGNESSFSDEVSANISAGDGGDTTPPALVAVAPKGETQIDVIFSEAVEKTSAENIANYTIDNGVQIIGAVLDSDPTVVHLITTTHGRGQQYDLTISNIQDLSGNGLPAGSTTSYNIPDPSQDDAAPELIYVAVKTETLVEVIFSEHVNGDQAKDVSNYSVDNGLQVTEARLKDNHSIVELTTTRHAAGTSYTLTVGNVQDLAGNPIGDKNSFTYETSSAEDNGDNASPNLVSVIARGETQLDVNFNEPISSLSAEDLGNYSIDNNIEVKGAVLSNNLTTVHLVTSSHTNDVEYSMTVTDIEDLAGNKVSVNNRVSYTYRANGDFRSDNGSQTPTSFSLFQNYPNPFNPETEIRFYLDEDQRINLTVYNQLGQVIRTLVQDEMSPGFHTVVWDGRNSDGKEVPTGVYIYSLEVTRNVLRDDLLVNVSLERRVKRMTLIR